MRRPRGVATALVFGLTANISAHAEDSPPPPPTAETIVVTGYGLKDTAAAPAFDVVHVSREALTDSASGLLEDSLSNVAGFQQYRRSDSRSANPTAQGVTLRSLGGNAAARTLVLLDGVPMIDPFFGSVPLSAMAPGRLASASVMRGGGSGAFGAGSVAGTVALESADAQTLGLVSGQALIDNRAETNLSATLAPQFGGRQSGKGFAEISGQWTTGEGFWTTPLSQRVPVSARAAYNDWSTSARVVVPIAADMELQGRFLAFDDKRTLRFAGANSDNSGQDLSVRLVGRGPWQFDALAYGQARDFSNIVVAASSTTRPLISLNQRSTPASGLGGKLELRPPLGDRMVLRIGTDWRRTDGRLYEDAFFVPSGAPKEQHHNGGTNNDIGVFAEDTLTLGHLTLTAGGREDRWSIDDGFTITTKPTGTITTNNHYANRSGWSASGRAGAVWRALPALALRGSAYTGFRQPTLNELYRSYTVSPVTYTANPALIAEQLKGYEGGLDLTPLAGLRLSGTAFYNRVAHAIANVTIGTNLSQRQNVNAIRARGLEFDAEATRGAFSLKGSLAVTDAVVEAPGATINGLRPAQTPDNAWSLTAGWRPRDGWKLGTTLRHVGAQYEDDLNTSILPAATTIGAFAELRLHGRLSLILRGENLADVSVETRNQAGSIDLGTPRTIWAGLRLGG